MRPRRDTVTLHFMKTLIVLSAVIAALATAPFATPASAAVLPKSETREAESASVIAMRALITRCLPSVMSDKAAPTAGLAKASNDMTRQVLGNRDGSVWMDLQSQVMMVDFHDQPSCRVIALTIDPAVLADLVMKVFAEASTPFKRQQFRLDEGGAFEAVYTSGAAEKSVTVRIEATNTGNGRRFATLSVERGPATP